MAVFSQNNIQPLVWAASVNSPFVFFKLHGFTEKLVLPDKTLFVLIRISVPKDSGTLTFMDESANKAAFQGYIM